MRSTCSITAFAWLVYRGSIFFRPKISVWHRDSNFLCEEKELADPTAISLAEIVNVVEGVCVAVAVNVPVEGSFRRWD
jgi:hypothetical protein